MFSRECCAIQEKLSTREGQRSLLHKNKEGTMGICYACSKYRLRQDFTETQWQKPRQRDHNVPRTCIECLRKGQINDVLNWTAIDELNPEDVLDFEQRPPRPEKVKTGRMLDTILDRTPDIDFAETQQKRDLEIDNLWECRGDRARKENKRRLEKGGN